MGRIGTTPPRYGKQQAFKLENANQRKDEANLEISGMVTPYPGPALRRIGASLGRPSLAPGACRPPCPPSCLRWLNGTGHAQRNSFSKPLVLSPFVRQNLRRYLSVPNHDDLVVLKELVESEKLKPVIDRTYPLHETPAAFSYIEAGYARGKVVITI